MNVDESFLSGENSTAAPSSARSSHHRGAGGPNYYGTSQYGNGHSHQYQCGLGRSSELDGRTASPGSPPEELSSPTNHDDMVPSTPPPRGSSGGCGASSAASGGGRLRTGWGGPTRPVVATLSESLLRQQQQQAVASSVSRSTTDAGMIVSDSTVDQNNDDNCLGQQQAILSRQGSSAYFATAVPPTPKMERIVSALIGEGFPKGEASAAVIATEGGNLQDAIAWIRSYRAGESEPPTQRKPTARGGGLRAIRQLGNHPQVHQQQQQCTGGEEEEAGGMGETEESTPVSGWARAPTGNADFDDATEHNHQQQHLLPDGAGIAGYSRMCDNLTAVARRRGEEPILGVRQQSDEMPATFASAPSANHQRPAQRRQSLSDEREQSTELLPPPPPNNPPCVGLDSHHYLAPSPQKTASAEVGPATVHVTIRKLDGRTEDLSRRFHKHETLRSVMNQLVLQLPGSEVSTWPVRDLSEVCLMSVVPPRRNVVWEQLDETTLEAVGIVHRGLLTLHVRSSAAMDEGGGI